MRDALCKRSQTNADISNILLHSAHVRSKGFDMSLKLGDASIHAAKGATAITGFQGIVFF